MSTSVLSARPASPARRRTGISATQAAPKCAGGCLVCGCSPSACAAGCGCTCCCVYPYPLPAVTGGSR